MPNQGTNNLGERRKMGVVRVLLPFTLNKKYGENKVSRATFITHELFDNRLTYYPKADHSVTDHKYEHWQLALHCRSGITK